MGVSGQNVCLRGVVRWRPGGARRPLGRWAQAGWAEGTGFRGIPSEPVPCGVARRCPVFLACGLGTAVFRRFVIWCRNGVGIRIAYDREIGPFLAVVAGKARPPRILCVMRKTICDSYRKNPHTLSLHWRRVRTDGGELFLFIVLSRPGRGGDELPYPKATVLNLSCACRRNASGLMPDTYSGRL